MGETQERPEIKIGDRVLCLHSDLAGVVEDITREVATVNMRGRSIPRDLYLLSLYPYNFDLMRQVHDRIASEDPDRFNMYNWITALPRSLTDLTAGKVAAHCGTRACIAGWTVLVGAPDLKLELYGEHCLVLRNVSVPTQAAKLLGLDRAEVQALFYAEGWTGTEHDDAAGQRSHALYLLDRMVRERSTACLFED